MIDELLHTSFDSFKKNINNLEILYHCTTEEGAEGIIKNGACREYTGKNSNFYGQGFYTTFTLDSTMDNSGGYYGQYIIKFGLDGGFKDFLFFDEEMNEKYNNGEPIESQIKRLCPPDIIQKLEQGGFYDAVNRDNGTHHLFNKKMTASGPKKFFEILKGNRLSDNHLTPWQRERGCYLFDEIDISRTKVRGYIFVGSNDGEVCVVRDFDSLIPLAYFDPTKGSNPSDLNDSGWINVLNQNTFNNLSNSIDVGTHIRGEYPETPLNTKTICGFILVKGKPSGKYNYLDIKTLKELLPVAADYAVDFDPQTGKAKFMIGGEEYEYNSNNGLFIEDGCFTYTRDEFAEELKDNGLLNENVKKIHSLINRINDL